MYSSLTITFQVHIIIDSSIQECVTNFSFHSERYAISIDKCDWYPVDKTLTEQKGSQKCNVKKYLYIFFW